MSKSYPYFDLHHRIEYDNIYLLLNNIKYMEEIKKIIEKNKKCEECKGYGEVATLERVYPNEPHEAYTGSATCPNCEGTGQEPDKQLVKDRIMDELSNEQLEEIAQLKISEIEKLIYE